MASKQRKRFFDSYADERRITLAPVTTKRIEPFKPITSAQALYAKAIDQNAFTFAIGPAGTGKSYVAAAKAAEHLCDDSRNRVILTRPAVEAAGETLGLLPGELCEKFGPFMKPFMRLMIDHLGKGFVECALKNERLQMVPMAYMRGESYEDSLIVADEMQNATREQFKMLLTRLGRGSRMVIDGDPRQSDVKDSGLEDAASRLAPIKGIAVIRFARSDIVRHDIIQRIIDAYEGEELDSLI